MKGYTTMPNIQEFKGYLLSQIPQNVADIKVEAAFETTSQLYLVSLPASVWIMLEKNENVEFVAHIKSGNKLQGGLSEATLVQRPKGSENIGFQGGSSSGTK